MWVVVHTVSGLALGAGLVSLGAPWWTLPLPALATHLALDVAPHWDYYSQARRVQLAALDVTASIVLTLAAWWALHLPGVVVLTGALAALPDLDALDVVIPAWRRFRWFPTHRPGFPHGQVGFRAGVAIQGGVFAILVGALILFAP